MNVLNHDGIKLGVLQDYTLLSYCMKSFVLLFHDTIYDEKKHPLYTKRLYAGVGVKRFIVTIQPEGGDLDIIVLDTKKAELAVDTYTFSAGRFLKTVT